MVKQQVQSLFYPMGIPLEKKEDMDSVESFCKFADGKCDTFLLLGEFSRMSGV